MIRSAASVTKLPNSETNAGQQQPQMGIQGEGEKWCMNLLQALVILTLIILATLRATLEGNAKVWGGGSPVWDEVFYLCLALETDESALSLQIEESTLCVSTVNFITLHQA